MSACTSQVQLSEPQNVTAVLSADNTVELHWEEVEEAENYRIYRKNEDDESFRYLIDVSDTSYQDKRVDAGESYIYKVSALNAKEESEASVSAVVEITGQPVIQEPIVLNAPIITSVTAMDKYTNVIIFEDENEDCTYQIMRSTSQNGEYELAGTTEDKAFYDEAYGTSYYYTVKAIKENSESEVSEPVLTGTNAKQVVGVPVIMYHEFVTEEDLANGVLFDEYAIYKDEFESDLKWLKENGYTTITTKELINYLEGNGTLPEKPIILTIDDGKYGVYKNAYPLLQEYDMKAVLAVIGANITEATNDPSTRVDLGAPYCTWEEIAEMSHSGHVEIISHTYGLHVYNHDNRQGANTAEGETSEEYFPAAYEDYRTIKYYFEKYNIELPFSQCYPYSIRSDEADDAWLDSGYKLLLSGDSVEARASHYNFFIQEAGINHESALMRRLVRMHGTSLSEYILDAIEEDS